MHLFYAISLLSLIYISINASILTSFLDSIEAQTSETINIVFNANNPSNNAFFVPEAKTINAGITIRWVNNDSTFHTVISGSYEKGPAGIFQSELIVTGADYSHKFNDKGIFPYYCTLHPFMTGTITVN
jgi:plastocyanin